MRIKISICSLVFFTLLVPFAQAEDSSPALPDKLRVCADPNNLPYSHKNLSGFENKIAEVLASSMGVALEYTWFPQRMGFIRNTLKSWSDEEGRFLCDLVIGVPSGFDMSATTAPYYRSAYTFVYKKSEKLENINTIEDLLALPETVKSELRIGAFTPSPSIDWLQRYHLFANTKTYQTMTGDPEYYPGKIIEEELLKGDLDVVFIWGPIAGYFAKMNPQANIAVVPLKSEPGIKFDYAMAMGMRYGEKSWKQFVEKHLSQNKDKIMGILSDYHIPLVGTAQP